MTSPQKPIHVGTLNGKPLRFYPPQAADDMMPWVAMDDLAAVLGMNRQARMALRQAKTEFPDLAKRIRTEGGVVDPLAYQAVQGLMGGLKEAGADDDALHLAFVHEAHGRRRKAESVAVRPGCQRQDPYEFPNARDAAGRGPRVDRGSDRGRGHRRKRGAHTPAALRSTTMMDNIVRLAAFIARWCYPVIVIRSRA